jgi:hypothetical protein
VSGYPFLSCKGFYQIEERQLLPAPVLQSAITLKTYKRGCQAKTLLHSSPWDLDRG